MMNSSGPCHCRRKQAPIEMQHENSICGHTAKRMEPSIRH
eukprot:COSAG02_NODE_37829_length_437_cov_0.609467_2_plen_39_part_01